MTSIFFLFVGFVSLLYAIVCYKKLWRRVRLDVVSLDNILEAIIVALPPIIFFLGSIAFKLQGL